MAEAKTRKTSASVPAFLKKATIGDRHSECETLVRMMAKATGAKAAMWGTAIVGFGSYPLVYADGRTEEWPLIAFSPRKAALTVYGTRASPKYAQRLKQLGKHKVGGGCLYLKSLGDVDLKVLQALLDEAVVARKKKSGVK